MIPTDLISTENVERHIGKENDILINKDNKSQNNHPSNNTKLSNTKFIPNENWLSAVKSELPLHTIMRLIKHLVPQLEELTQKGFTDESKVIEFLHNTTMVGLLPVPHPIVIRKYQPNKYTCLWFTAFLWGVVFMHNQNLTLFDSKNVKLFLVQSI